MLDLKISRKTRIINLEESHLILRNILKKLWNYQWTRSVIKKKIQSLNLFLKEAMIKEKTHIIKMKKMNTLVNWISMLQELVRYSIKAYKYLKNLSLLKAKELNKIIILVRTYMT